jgi:prefoldin subunit 5
MTLRPHKSSNVQYTEIVGGQRQIPEFWTESKLVGRKFRLIGMKDKRKEEVRKYQSLIREMESQVDSIERELKDCENTLRERMKENPENIDNVLLIRTKTGYTKGKIRYMGRWRWVHLGVTSEIEDELGYSDEKLKKMVVNNLRNHIVNRK